MSRTLSKPANTKIGERLKELRENRGLSLYRLAEQLNQQVTIQLDGKSGQTRISAIENSHANLTSELALAYSKNFDVSLEYIFCISDDMRPENKDIKEVLRLSDITISKIRAFSEEKNSDELLKVLNILFEHGFMLDLVRSLESFIYLSHFYNDCITLSFDDRQEDDRQEDDREFAKLIPRWRLNKSVLDLTEKIAHMLEKMNA